MSDLRIGAVGSGAPVGAPAAAVTTTKAKGPGFGDALRNALHEVNQLQHGADAAAQDFALGKTRDVASTLIAVEKANLAFQFTMHVRTKLVEAYQEIMRMPV